MICDGAKESCGLKVSNAASEAWSAAMLALENRGIRNTQGIISPDIHELGITLREFNEKIFSAADSVMIGLMSPSEQECGKPRLIPAPRKPGRLQPGNRQEPRIGNDPWLLGVRKARGKTELEPREEGSDVRGYSAIFLETGLNTCGKGTQIWDCLPGPPETKNLMDSVFLKRGIKVFSS